MNNKSRNAFILSCKNFLSAYSLNSLRAYGRSIGVYSPTKLKKPDLIDRIVEILVGAVIPIEQGNQGAPIKNDYFEPEIPQKIAEFRALYLAEEKGADEPYFDFDPKNMDKNVLEVASPNVSNLRTEYDREIYRGQLTTVDSVSYLLPLDGSPMKERLVVSVEFIRYHDLREGDVITCHAQKSQSVLFVTEILTKNGLVDGPARPNFEDAPVVSPNEKFVFSNKNVTEKCFSWLLPLAKGQRGVVLAPPKTGKTQLLLNVTKSLIEDEAADEVFVALIEQSPETFSAYSKFVPKGNLIYTSYEEDSDKHVSAAEFILKRAKRYAETGKDVVLIVDSFSALMRAFNDIDFSKNSKTLACGVESSTVRYLKKYLGAARAFEKYGSLTVIGSMTFGSGNPADDVVSAEMKLIANAQIYLTQTLALQRVFPAFDFASSSVENGEILLSDEERAFELYAKNGYIPQFGVEKLYSAMSKFDEILPLTEALKRETK